MVSRRRVIFLAVIALPLIAPPFAGISLPLPAFLQYQISFAIKNRISYKLTFAAFEYPVYRPGYVIIVAKDGGIVERD
jgi:hypothetical protein